MNLTAGCRHFELLDEQMDMPFPVVVMYPGDSPEAFEKLGPFALNVSMNGSLATGPFPLVVVSHGTGGSHLSHRTLAAHLARNGFVVALPEHPRNNRNNNELAGTEAILGHRPRQLRQIMDWAYSSDVFGRLLKPNAAAIIGHSLGGYTALATAGGHPTAFPWETPDQKSRPVAVTHDDRVRALVLLAPAAAWYLSPDSLRDVRGSNPHVDRRKRRDLRSPRPEDPARRKADIHARGPQRNHKARYFRTFSRYSSRGQQRGTFFVD